MSPIDNDAVRIIRRTAVVTATIGERPCCEVQPGDWEAKCIALGRQAREIERLLAELLLRREGKAALA